MRAEGETELEGETNEERRITRGRGSGLKEQQSGNKGVNRGNSKEVNWK